MPLGPRGLEAQNARIEKRRRIVIGRGRRTLNASKGFKQKTSNGKGIALISPSHALESRSFWKTSSALVALAELR